MSLLFSLLLALSKNSMMYGKTIFPKVPFKSKFLSMKMMRLLFLINFITIIYVGCSAGNTDVDIKANIESKLKARPEMSGVTVGVKNGIATIEGQCKDE